MEADRSGLRPSDADERLEGYDTLRHSFISILVAQGKAWDRIAAFVGHSGRRTTQRYIRFTPKDELVTAISITFDSWLTGRDDRENVKNDVIIGYRTTSDPGHRRTKPATIVSCGSGRTLNPSSCG